LGFASRVSLGRKEKAKSSERKSKYLGNQMKEVLDAYMWYITLKKDLCSEECRKSCIIKMYSSAKVRSPRRNPDDFRTYKQTIF
jgi:hypothetical protein